MLEHTLMQMTHDEEAGFGIVARTAHAFLAKADRDRFGVLSSAIRHTTFLDDPRIVASLSRSDFTLGNIKKKRMTVYIALPPAKLHANHRFMRCFVWGWP